MCSYDPGWPKQLLDQAGWTVGSTAFEKGGLKLEFWSTTTRTDRVQLMAVFQKNLADVGIKVLPDVKRPLSFSVISPKSAEHTDNLVRMGFW